MDPISLAIGAALFALGAVVGRARRRGASDQTAPALSSPICGCTHDLALHDPKTGACAGKIRTPISWHSSGSEINWRMEPCSCKQYTGPRPYDSVFIQPTLPPLEVPPPIERAPLAIEKEQNE